MKLFRSLLSGLTLLVVADLPVCAQTADSFNPNANNVVLSSVVQADGKIIVGGWFTTIGGQTRNGIAKLNADGSLDSGFNPNPNNDVYCLAIQADGKIIVGGYFTTIGGQTRNRLARLNADGSLDTGFNPNANNGAPCLAVQPDGKIIVGGFFTTIGGQTRNRIARLNADGSLDLGFNPNVAGTSSDHVGCLAVQEDGKILLGGQFQTVSGQTRSCLARLNADGSLDTGFDPNPNSNPQAFAVQADGKIVVAGGFTTICGQPRNRIARLNSDGGIDPSFDPNANDSFETLALQADGKILGGGYFSLLGGQTRHYIARLNANGSLDLGFNPNVAGLQPHVDALVVQSDGKILTGGSFNTNFNTIGGQPRNYIARLNNDTAATSALAVTGISQIDWARGGSAPEVSQVTFERWSGTAWLPLGNATRVLGGWRLVGLNLPASGQIRARGRTTGGNNNGSSSLIDQTIDYSTSYSDAWRYQFFGTTANAGNAADNADPDRDGLVNLLERAFNLNPNQAGVPVLPPGTGTSGLPLIRQTGQPPVFSIQYLRLKASINPGLSYSPQFTSDLVSWQDFTGTATVQSIDANWERVTVEDTATGQAKRFGRVQVSSAP